MKRNHMYPMQLALGACLALSFGGPTLAEEAAAPDTSAWECKYCVVPEGWFGELEFGGIYLDDWSPKFGDYRGFDDDGFFIGAGGDASYRNAGGYYLDLTARELGLDSRALDVRGGKQGGYELQLSYSEIPRYMGYGTVTPYSGVGGDRLTLPEGWTLSQADPSDFVPLALGRQWLTIVPLIWIPSWLISFPTRRVSSASTRSTSRRTRIARSVTSSRFPIGVATT